MGISIALIAAGIWFLCNHQSTFGYGDVGWPMPNYMMMTGDGLGVIKIMFWAIVLLSIGLVTSGVISIRRSSGNCEGQAFTDAVNMLKRRYARGEIDKSQFEAMRHDLDLKGINS